MWINPYPITVVPGSIPRIILSSTTKIILLAKTKKIRRNLFWILKLIIFSGVIYLLYRQLQNVEEDAWRQVDFVSPYFLLIAFLLIPLNIGLAYLKWETSIRLIDQKMNKPTKLQSFFAGVVTGLITPNMLGNFIGRLYYFERDKRAIVTALTMVSNFGQFLASFIFGWISLLVAGEIFGWGYFQSVNWGGE